jgi:hypothetical protein
MALLQVLRFELAVAVGLMLLRRTVLRTSASQ